MSTKRPLAALEAPLQEPTEVDAIGRVIQFMVLEPDSMVEFLAASLHGQCIRHEASKCLATAALLQGARKYAAFRKGDARLLIGGAE